MRFLKDYVMRRFVVNLVLSAGLFGLPVWSQSSNAAATPQPTPTPSVTGQSSAANSSQGGGTAGSGSASASTTSTTSTSSTNSTSSTSGSSAAPASATSTATASVSNSSTSSAAGASGSSSAEQNPTDNFEQGQPGQSSASDVLTAPAPNYDPNAPIDDMIRPAPKKKHKQDAAELAGGTAGDAQPQYADQTQDTQAPQGQPYASPLPQSILFAGENLPPNVFFAGVNTDVMYDTNMHAGDYITGGSLAYTLGGQVDYRTTSATNAVSFEYDPSYTDYVGARGLNTTSQTLGLGLTQSLGERLAVNLTDGFDYDTGLYSPLNTSALLIGVDPGSLLNPSIVAPTAHELENNGTVTLNFRQTSRSDWSVFGGDMIRRFSRQSLNYGLFNTNGYSGGLQYGYRLTEHTSVGLMYMYQDLRMSSFSHMLVNTGYLSLSHRFSENLRASIFGGPEHSKVHENVTIMLPLFGGLAVLHSVQDRSSWYPTFGGSIDEKTPLAAFQLTAERQETDGGGLLPFPLLNTSVMLSAHRPLVSWDVRFRGGYGRSTVAGMGQVVERLTDWTGGILAEHPVTSNLSMQLGYSLSRQRNAGVFAELPNMTLGQFSFGLLYRIKEVSLGQ